MSLPHQDSTHANIGAAIEALKRLDDVHFAVVRSYLRAAGLDHGLLLDFSAPKLQMRRVMSTAGPKPLPGFKASLEVQGAHE